MAGFLAGVAEGYKSARQRIEAREAREEELAYRRAKDKAQEERFKLTHGENVKQTEYAQKKYFLEKARTAREKLEKQKKLEKEQKDKGYKQITDAAMKGFVDFGDTYTIKETEFGATGELDDTTVGPEGLAKMPWRKGDQLYVGNKRIQEAADALGLNLEQLMLAGRQARQERGAKSVKVASETAETIYGGSVKEALEAMQKGKIPMFPANDPIWIKIKRLNPHITHENVEKINHKQRISKRQTSDREALNKGETIPLTGAYPSLLTKAIKSDNVHLLGLNIMPVRKEGKVQQHFTRDIFNKDEDDITNDDEELMIKFMTMMDGALQDSHSQGEDNYTKLINTLNTSTHLKNDLVKAYSHFNDRQLDINEGITEGYTLAGSRVLKNFKGLKSIISPLLEDGEYTPDEKIKDNFNSFQTAVASGSLDDNKTHQDAERQQAITTPANSPALKNQKVAIFSPSISPTAWAMRHAVMDQRDFVRHISLNSPEHVKKAIDSLRMQDWGANLNPLTEGQESVKEQKRTIAKHLIELSNKHGWSTDQLNQVAVNLVTGNFVYHEGTDNNPGSIREKYNVLKVKGKVYKEISGSIENSRKGLRNIDDLEFLFLSNDSLVANIAKNDSYKKGGLTFKSMTSLTSDFAQFIDIGKGEFNEIVGFLKKDNRSKSIGNILGKGEFKFTHENRINMEEYLGDYIAKAEENIQKQEEANVMNQDQLKIYSQIQLQKVKLAYTLAGVFQGGSSGSRTISDQDFKIIMDALWSPDETRVRANLRELHSSLSYAKHEALLAQKIGTVTGAHDKVRDAMYQFGKVLRTELAEQDHVFPSRPTKEDYNIVGHSVKFFDPSNTSDGNNISFNFNNFSKLVNSTSKPLNINDMDNYFKYKLSLYDKVIASMDRIEHAQTNEYFKRHQLFEEGDEYTDEKWARIETVYKNLLNEKNSRTMTEFMNTIPVFQKMSTNSNRILLFNYDDFKKIDAKLNNRIFRIRSKELNKEFREKYNFWMGLAKEEASNIPNYQA